MKKAILLVILIILLGGCSSNDRHNCNIKAIKECGENNVEYIDLQYAFSAECVFECKDYLKYLEE